MCGLKSIVSLRIVMSIQHWTACANFRNVGSGGSLADSVSEAGRVRRRPVAHDTALIDPIASARRVGQSRAYSLMAKRC